MIFENILTLQLLHDPTFCVYQDGNRGSFKRGRSIFNYNEKHIIVDGRNYKTTQVVWELLTKINLTTWSLFSTDKHKQNLLQCNAHRVIYISTGKMRAKVSNILRLFHNSLLT